MATARRATARERGMMQGFDDLAPIFADVSWTDGEVPLLNAQPTTYGLLAEIPIEGGIRRYFVPWTSVTFLRQDILYGAPATQPVVIQPNTPVGQGETAP
jgi:hypothetical protein